MLHDRFLGKRPVHSLGVSPLARLGKVLADVAQVLSRDSNAAGSAPSGPSVREG